MNSERDLNKARSAARKTAMWLGLVALGFYLGIMAMGFFGR